MTEPKDGEGFFARWSRRKVQGGAGDASAAPAAVPDAALPTAPPRSTPRSTPSAEPPAQRPTASLTASPVSSAEPLATKPPAHAPALTIDDVQALTKDSDYSAFASPRVDPQVRNAAMKKLFASDPHFNVMDGLDVYIDDYNKSVPIPKALLKTMVQARFLGLIDDEVVEQPKPAPAAASAPDADPNSAKLDDATTHPDDENADLQLQPNDAARADGPGRGLAAGAAAPQISDDAAKPDDSTNP